MSATSHVGRCDVSRPGRRDVRALCLGIEFSCHVLLRLERQWALQASTKLTGFACRFDQPRGCATPIESGFDCAKVRPVVP